MGAEVLAARSGEEPGTRERILSTALELFTLKGYDATSMREISEQVGTTKAALYYHFASKEEIVATLVRELQSRLSGLVEWAHQRAAETDDLDVLRAETLERWTAIMQAHGVQVFRFIAANRYVLDNARATKVGMRDALAELQTLLTSPDAPVEEQLRVRMSLACVSMLGMVASGIDAPDDQVMQAAHTIALDLMLPPSTQES